MRTTPCIALLLLIAQSANAQRDHFETIPAGLANAPANSSTAFPFGHNAAIRLQAIYNSAETGLSQAFNIAKIQVRTDENSAQAAKTGIDLQIAMSTTSVGAGTQTATFATNRGANHKIVFNRKLVSLPATTPSIPGQPTTPFLLDSPFVYDPTAGNLLVEWDIASQPAGAYNQDTPFSNTGAHYSYGAGCNGVTALSSGGGLGLTITWTMAGGDASGIGVHILGLAKLGSPLPIPGSPGCNLYVSLDVLSVVTLSATGTGTLTFPVPADPSLRSVPVQAQYVTVRTPLRFDSSNARETYLGGQYQIARVYSAGSNTALTGISQDFAGMVIGVDHP